MPSINFKGKNAVWNHHLSVPYQILEKDKKLSVKGKNEDENLIIEADNLLALKSLLPKYQGRIRCMYIDPPYNTGNEGWIYNDKVNSPLIKEWLGKAVGSDDLTRHDKWLCMMTPRLKLLYELLDEKGIIFISIDDNEVHFLKELMEEIFGEDNVDICVWKKVDPKYDKNVNAKIITRTKRIHEFIVIGYKNKKDTIFEKIKKLPNWLNKYTNPDKDPRGPYKQGIISFQEGHEKEDKNSENYYSIVAPSGRKITRHFFITKDEFDDLNSDNRIYFPKSGDGVPAIKIFENEEKDFYFETILEGVGSLNSAKKELAEIFSIIEEDVFDTPKPTKLIKEIIRATAPKDAIILDSFAGTGTTAHAVLDLNKEDGKSGNRKFILVQLPEKIEKDMPAYKAGFRFVHEIMRERVSKAIKMNKYEAGYSYMKLGSKIDADSILSGDLPSYKDFAKYVFYLATGKIMENEKSINEKDYFVGKANGEPIYLIYTKNNEKLRELAITLDWAEIINKKDKSKKIVYAPACFLDEEYLDKFNIHFVSIPYNLFEKK
ncbi:hypothetical protein A2643_03405 [Candidatus Nomurabacteria bacterium RIFCSPHIGHO2_01_FULL_39_220]|uniref:DNA methylase N-4/N-6 domain-containing protein n=1 Tax=Candidatus Nomurabacteria bacterium RIFCSPLOWO2_02_FULL_40_67 TaxID=1801787 RepID=A0A1F6Y4S2_9BACT|nr:MAG: hypothetical protein A2W12_03655 [Candidatus Nomurabacteria bacterium RBG_16_40_11]OGI69846.1 MAG: hypothetical protein A2643_03405 [Candidatus Nomurabacteria bacterium RIFCSPHIGHO2_01_FULL_39_220]OGI72759.1 MAG: hypothetical protein A2W56_00015 [Candidatus Nomurabacteria bacterium RIFCSPHIGHO2_02_41_18]OGI81376.1 MAG: hypothetical protein A3E03_03100 [Candidatus Nomurabacteria bacterium RIFCSPHIGHO2_12_FULL_40_64]OGI91059.1 MAG: hypothetical protein A3A06_03195 [Candidatus Nomurabacter